jgi:hypothetical protein
MNYTTIRIKEFVPMLERIIAHNRACGEDNAPAHHYMVPHIVSDPGMGKTSAVNRASVNSKVECQTVVPVSMDATDAMGLPTFRSVEDETYTTWTTPDLLFRLKPGATLFIDEFTKAPQMIMCVFSQLLEERRINTHYLNKFSTIVTAGNHIANRAGDQDLPTHVYGRLISLYLTNPPEDFLDWAASVNLATQVTGYVAWRKGGAFKFDANAKCNPTQRSWANVAVKAHGKHMDGIPTMMLRALVAGMVGEGAAADYIAFLRCRDEMPHPEKIISDPNGAPVPDSNKPDILWAIVSALTGHATVKTIGPIMTYLGRIKAQEFTVFAIKDIMARNPKLTSAPEMLSWKMKNRHLFTPIL